MVQHRQASRGEIGPRRIDQQLDASRPLASPLDQPLDIVELRHVRHTHFDGTPCAMKLSLQLLQPLLASSGGDHMKPLARQGHRDGTTHPARGTDNNGRLIANWIGHLTAC